MNQSTEDQILALVDRQVAVEEETLVVHRILQANDCDLYNPLVDAEGAPLPGIDVDAVRRARVRFIELHDESLELMVLVNKASGQLRYRVRPGPPPFGTVTSSRRAPCPSPPPCPNFKPCRTRPLSSSGNRRFPEEAWASVPEPVAQPDGGTLVPFAKVDSVVRESPAATAGIRRQDLILAFGPLVKSSSSTPSMRSLDEYAAAQKNHGITVKILRAPRESMTLTLTPKRTWGGRGLLGCEFIPFPSA